MLADVVEQVAQYRTHDVRRHGDWPSERQLDTPECCPAREPANPGRLTHVAGQRLEGTLDRLHREGQIEHDRGD
jgi:hypothetical protein